MSALTKADIAERLAGRGSLSKQQAKSFVDDLFGLVSDLLVEGHDLKFSGFGVFYLRDKSERIGRNPKTGEEVPITARRVVTFRPGQKLRAMVEGGCEDGDNAGTEDTGTGAGSISGSFGASDTNY